MPDDLREAVAQAICDTFTGAPVYQNLDQKTRKSYQKEGEAVLRVLAKATRDASPAMVAAAVADPAATLPEDVWERMHRAWCRENGIEPDA